MFKSFRSLCAALALVSTAAAFTMGCQNADHEEPAAEAGTLTAALTTTGTDGAVYGFPPDAYLYVSRVGFADYIPLYGAETLLEKRLPAGSYSLSLYYPSGSVELTRTENSVISNVEAEWTNPQPVTIDIVDAQITPLVLSFSVPGLTDLTFDTGTLQVTAEVVEEAVPQAGNTEVAGQLQVALETYAHPNAAYASELDVDLGAALPAGLTFEASGPWAQYSSTRVCQSGTISAVDGGSSAGLSQRLSQLIGGSSFLCIDDTGAADWVSIVSSSYGPAPAGQEIFLPDSAYSFNLIFSAQIADVYDGTTLQQLELELPAALTYGFLGHVIYDAQGTALTEVNGNFAGTIRLLP